MEQEPVKIVLLGASGVGKSSILKRYISEEFETIEQPTLGASFHSKIVKNKNKTYKFQIWDTAGQEKYAPLAVMYYRDAHIVLLVYDITNKQSFEALKGWHEEIKEKGLSDVVIFVVGNKTDLIQNEQTDPETAKNYADSIGAAFKMTSAKQNNGIKELFEKIIEKVTENRELTNGTKKGSKISKKDSENDLNDGTKCC